MNLMNHLPNSIRRSLVALLLLFAIVFLAIQPQPVSAQASTQGWAPPVNVSRTGGATDPAIVVDSKGVKHAIWVDIYNGFMVSEDSGNGWTEPKAVKFPFSPIVNTFSNTKPVYVIPKLIDDGNGRIHAFWIGDRNILYEANVSEAYFGRVGSWTGRRGLSDLAIAMDVSMDGNGVIHIVYIHNIDLYSGVAGIYYRTLTRSFALSNPVELVASPYFRSITADSANLNIATAQAGDATSVYVAWDNQPRNRVSVIESTDGGKTWGEAMIVDGPEVSAGPVLPRDIKVGASGSNAVVVWQVDQPGNNCLQNYKWTNDAGQTWQAQQRMLTSIQGCADENQFLSGSNGVLLLMTKILGQVYLHAWNGSRWSDPQLQEILTSFIDQQTYNLVNLSGQSITMSPDNTLTVVGYDTGPGGDIWQTSRQITSVDSWFSTQNAWTLPVSVSSSAANNFANGLVVDRHGFVHFLWSQVGTSADGGNNGTLAYSRWDGNHWSTPLAVVDSPGISVSSPSVSYSNNKLYVVFSNQISGDIEFTSATSGQAIDSKAWSDVTALPVPRRAADSPQIAAAPDGSLFVVYSVPINENRGIYVVRSTDGGATWSSPAMVFDAAKANWPVVDYPQLVISDAQHLHLLFTQYAQPGRN